MAGDSVGDTSSGRVSSTGTTDANGFLGQKRRSISVFDSYSKANPRFSEGREWQINCQRCVYTYEMRRRGYDVEALPNNGEPTPWWDKAMEGMHAVYVGSNSASDSANMIVHQMSTYGVGARGFVYVAWKSGSAHVFNVEQTRNGTIFVDAQTGKRVDINVYLSYAKTEMTQLYRTDNCKPTELLKKCFKRRGT